MSAVSRFSLPLKVFLMRNLELTLSSLVLLSIGALAQSQPTATLTSSNPIFGAVLGSQVAISGSTVVSPADYQQGAPQDVAIFVFTKPATAPWTDMTES